ncbi:MAG: MFS transporter [Candidatus Bathyarchaeia archaeon]
MLKKYFLEEFGISRKDFFIIFSLLLNAFVWYSMTLNIISNVSNTFVFTDTETLTILATYHVAVIASSIAGSILSYKIRRVRFLYLWMFLGVVTSLLPFLIDVITITYVLGICFLWGVSFGLGMPSCLAFFADCSLIENRGRVSGIILFTIIISFFPVALLFKGIRVDLTTNYVISALWRTLGLIVFFLLKPEEKIATEVKKHIPFVSIFHNRHFILYFIPWVMFYLVDRSGESVLRTFLKTLFGANFYSFVQMTGPIIGSFSALIGGMLSDWIGRKRMVIFGFVALGLAYAVIGIAPTNLISWYFYRITDGIAWGILSVSFILILWGDLSQLGAREKYYVIGSMPYFLTGVIQLLSAPYVTMIPPSAVFSLASFFLFVAVLPLMYAPETLPEKKIRLRQLRGYVEKAKKVRKKYLKKSGAS